MNSDTILDYARFQLSPGRTRCELFVSGGGKTAKLASGFLKPFLTHLKVAEEQTNHASRLIKLEVDKRKNAGTWFSKGTLERFVRFVSTPEVLELVNTFDAEMSQLEGARKIYSQGTGDRFSGANEPAAAAAADITKKELLRAIDVRLTAVKQDLATACARASAAGFTLDTVSKLLIFSDRFGAFRLNEACTKFISLCQRRPELITHQKSPPSLIQSQLKGFDDAKIRSSSDSDMSIDEPEVEPAGNFGPFVSGTGGTSAETYLPTTGQPLQKSAADVQPIARFFVEKDTSKTKEDPTPRGESSDEPVQPATGGSRRLSVQDRINLFESKQKVQSASAGVTSSSSGGPGTNRTVAGKGEHRRLPSDASLEKAVPRRWSGASDMSIDVTNTNSFTSDRKESGSAAGTPSSYSNSHVQSVGKAEEGAGVLNDTGTSLPMLGPKDNSTTTGSSSSSSSSSSSFSSFQAQTISAAKNRERGEDYGLLKEGTARTSHTQSEPYFEKGLGDSNTETGSYMNIAHQGGSSHEIDMAGGSKFLSETGEDAKVKDHTASLAQFDGVAVKNMAMKDQASSQIPSRAVPETLVKDKSKDQSGADTVGVGSQLHSILKFRKFAERTEDGRGKQKAPLDSQLQSEASLGKVEGVTTQNDLHSQAYWKTCPVNREGVSLGTGSGSQRMQPHRRTSIPDQMKKAQGKREERVPNQGTSIPVFSAKKETEQEDVLQIPATPPVEQIKLTRPLKGNSELNDELQMKADELEKIFAAHKLRVHGDQTYLSRKSKTIGAQASKLADKRPLEVFADQSSEGNAATNILSNGVEFDTNLLMKMVDSLDSAHRMKQKLGTDSPLDDSRGKLYDKYMQKRDAKIREEWGSKRPQREAKMKAMHDSLEHSHAEMKAKLAGDKRDSILARRHADKIIHSTIRNKGQAVEPLQRDHLHALEQVVYTHERCYSDTLSGNESSTSCKKLVSSKSLSSLTQRSAAEIPKPSAKATNSGSIKRRAQLENTLAQSVPSFLDLRKENTKPVACPSKVTSRSQARTFAQSKSDIDEAHLFKEDKSRRSHSVRKSLAISGELKDMSPLSSDDANLTPLKSSKEQMEQGVNKIQSSELKQFLRKGNVICPGSGAGIAKLKSITNTEADDEDFEGLMDQREGSLDVVKDEGEEFDGRSAEGNIQATYFPADLNSENGDPGPEVGDVLRSLSPDVDDSIDVSSKFIPCAENVPESPGGSPGSWNSNIHHSFSYAHEASDIDFSVDSLTGSPTSCNSHPLNQMVEADAARMRKKWGSAHIPVLVVNAPHHPRKDVTKGFKRLLKFGRKSRGAEYLVNDWVSVSTVSEGDDDTEDGKELGSQTSDEFRKSRKGYSMSNYDGFNDGDTFPEQAPRSFFSLSSFRSKGSEAKPR